MSVERVLRGQAEVRVQVRAPRLSGYSERDGGGDGWRDGQQGKGLPALCRTLSPPRDDKQASRLSAYVCRWCITSQTTPTRSSPSIFRTNFLVQKLCKSKRFLFFSPSFYGFSHIFMSFCREGQPLKLPETKKTLLFTFNGEYSR